LLLLFSADLAIDPKMDVPSQLQAMINGSSPSLNICTAKEALNIENFYIKTAIQVDKNPVRLSLPAGHESPSSGHNVNDQPNTPKGGQHEKTN
jgi:hypothetical protein